MEDQQVRAGRGHPAFLVALGAGLAAFSLARPFLVVIDDGLFYLVIGRNLAAGRGTTFSEVMPTNGFQPLWQAVVTPLIWLAEHLGLTGATSQLRLVIVLGWALLGVGLVLLDRLLGEIGAGADGRFAALLLALAYLGGPGFTIGTEANLVLLLAVATLRTAHRLRQHTDAATGLALGTGALAGLLVLGRLDTVFLATAVLGAVALGPARVSGRIRCSRTAWAALAATGVVAPYLLWNLAVHDHVMPIAGAIKVDTSRVAFSPGAVGVGAMALLAVAAVGGAVAFLGRPPSPLRTWWAVALTGALAASAWYTCFSAIHWTGGGWYHVPQVLAAALAAAGAVDRLTSPLDDQRRHLLLITGTALATVAIVLVDRSFFLRPSYRTEIDAVVEFGHDVAAAVPDGGVVAVADYPGVIALTSRRPTVAFDGLTGDYEYQSRQRDLGASCAYGRLGVGYVMTRLPDPVRQDADGAYLVPAGSSIYDAGWSDLRLAPDDEVAADATGELRLFRFHPECS